MGYRLSDIPHVVSWTDIKLMVKFAQPGSAVFQEVSGEAGAWRPTDYLLAHLIDIGRAANWQRGGDSHAPYPPSFPRPGIESEQVQQEGVSHSGAEPVSPEEFNAWWNMEVTR